MNRLQIMGYLGKDPELQTLQGGQKVARLRVATTERAFVTADGRQYPERTTWHSVSLWGAMADAAAAMLQKGSRVYVEGTLHMSEITDRDGRKITYYQCDATTCEFLSGLKPKAAETIPPPTTPPPGR